MSKRTTRKDIQIALEGGGFAAVDALTLGALAVHKVWEGDGCYTITHLPSGHCLLSVSGCFETARAAMAAAKELSTLTDWATITRSRVTTRLGEQVRAICAKHGGFGGGRIRNRRSNWEPLNGYAEAQP